MKNELYKEIAGCRKSSSEDILLLKILNQVVRTGEVSYDIDLINDLIKLKSEIDKLGYSKLHITMLTA